MTTLYLIVILSYLLGSIPFGYLLVRTFQGADIRQRGSGNIGATNVARAFPVLGLVTLVLDTAKGYFAVYLAFLTWVQMEPFTTVQMVTSIASVAAASAIVGHMFPVWLKFRGGKGVATALGSFFLFAPKAVLAIVAIFAVIVLVTRYVSLGSIVAIALFPLLAWRLDLPLPYPPTRLVWIILITTCLLIVAKHYGNIRRLLKGTENKLWGRK